MAILKDLIVHGSSRFLNKIYASEIQTPLIEAEAGIFKKLKADDATVVGLLDVKGQMHTNSWSNSNIATIDGSFYITPTIGSDSGTVTITTSSLNFSGTNYAVSSLYLGDGSSITWPQYSKVLVTGQILSNGEWIPLGTLLGQLSSTATTASISINNIKDNKNQTSNVLATLVSNGTTSSNYRNLKVSLYQRASSSTAFYPLGIYMTAIGTNGRTFLDIYGGVEVLSNSNNYGGFAEPNVRIGNLQGLPNVGGQTPNGWGIYTDNGYFKGIIAADKGYIGSGSKYWVIANEEDISNVENSRSYIYNGTDNINSNTPGVYLGTDGIRNYKDNTHNVTIKDGVITAKGVNLTGQITATSGTIGGASITDGTLIVSNANISDINASKINAGDIAAARIQTNLISAIDAKVSDLSALTATIGGFQIDLSSVHTKSVAITSNADNSIALSSADFTRTINSTSRTGLRLAIGDKFGVTGDGKIYASSVDLTGKITATSGTIGGIEIENGALKVSSINIGNLGGASNYAEKTDVTQAIDNIEIGGRNLLKKSNNLKSTDTTKGITFTYLEDGWFAVKGTVTGTSAGVLCFYGNTSYTSNITSSGEYTLSIETDGTIFLPSNKTFIQLAYHSDNATNNTLAGDFKILSGSTKVTFTIPENHHISRVCLFIQANATDSVVDGNIRLKLEKGNKATDWTPAPEDIIVRKNLIPLSKNLKLFTPENLTRSIVTYTDDSCTITNTYGDVRYGVYYDIDVESGSTYTLSFQASNVSGTNINYGVGNRTSDQTASWNTITGGYKNVVNGSNVCSFTIPDTVTKVRIYFGAGSLNGTMTISNLKLEVGNRATEWTSAPEDIQYAMKVANNYLSMDSTGIMVADMNDGEQTPSEATGNNVFIDNTSVNIRDGQTTLASFGVDGMQIGLSNESHTNQDYHSWQMIDKEGNTYVNISDLRDITGVATVTEKDVSLTTVNNQTLIDLSFKVSSVISVTINDTPVSSFSIANAPFGYISTTPVPVEGDSIVVVYTSPSAYLKAYSLGIRRDGSDIGAFSFVEGYDTTASGHYSHAEGNNSLASGKCSHAEGYGKARGVASHAESSGEAIGQYSHAEGSSFANGMYSHAEGDSNAVGVNSHAENASYAAGLNSHAEGKSTEAIGDYSHAEGYDCIAYNDYSHAEGCSTNASGAYSHAQNLGTKAGSKAQTAIGQYNIYDGVGNYAFIIGNGADDSNRSNALTVKWDGTITAGNGFSTANTTLTISKVISSTYMNDTQFSRIKAYKKNGMLYLCFNAEFTSTGYNSSSDFTTIGKISGWNAVFSSFANIPRQTDGSKIVTLFVKPTGEIQVYSTTPISGWHRASICVPCSS